MAITEESRHNLFKRLAEVLGEQQAVTLMEHLPPVGWADVATKRDLDAFGREFRLELDRVGAELRGEMAQLGADLRGEMAHFGADLRGEMAQLGAGLRGEISDLRVEFQRELRLNSYAVMGALSAVGTLLFAVGRLLG